MTAVHERLTGCGDVDRFVSGDCFELSHVVVGNTQGKGLAVAAKLAVLLDVAVSGSTGLGIDLGSVAAHVDRAS